MGWIAAAVQHIYLMFSTKQSYHQEATKIHIQDIQGLPFVYGTGKANLRGHCVASCGISYHKLILQKNKTLNIEVSHHLKGPLY